VELPEWAEAKNKELGERAQKHQEKIITALKEISEPDAALLADSVENLMDGYDGMLKVSIEQIKVLYKVIKEA